MRALLPAVATLKVTVVAITCYLPIFWGSLAKVGMAKQARLLSAWCSPLLRGRLGYTRSLESVPMFGIGCYCRWGGHSGDCIFESRLSGCYLFVTLSLHCLPHYPCCKLLLQRSYHPRHPVLWQHRAYHPPTCLHLTALPLLRCHAQSQLIPRLTPLQHLSIRTILVHHFYFLLVTGPFLY